VRVWADSVQLALGGESIKKWVLVRAANFGEGLRHCDPAAIRLSSMPDPRCCAFTSSSSSCAAISPMIWRRLLLWSDQSIADLHYTIQIAMDRSDSHLHRFHIHGKIMALRTRVASVFLIGSRSSRVLGRDGPLSANTKV
jgi:hypothetical protein